MMRILWLWVLQRQNRDAIYNCNIHMGDDDKDEKDERNALVVGVTKAGQ